MEAEKQKRYRERKKMNDHKYLKNENKRTMKVSYSADVSYSRNELSKVAASETPGLTTATPRA